MGRFAGFISPTRKKVASNTVSQLIGKAVGTLASFFVTFLVARQLGASGYGDFIKITTYVAFFYLFADFGINAIYLQQSQSRISWPSLIMLRTVGGLLLISLALTVVSLLPSAGTQGYTPFVKWGIVLFSPTILLQAWITTGNAIFQKRLRYDIAAWAIFFGSVVSVGLLYVLFFALHITGVVPALLSLAAGTLVTSATALGVALRVERAGFFHISIRDLFRLFVPAIPLGVTLLFNLVYVRADSVIITLTRPTQEVGIYGLAYKAFEVILVFPTFFMNAVYPLMVSETAGKSNGRLTRIFSQSFFFLLVISILAGGTLWFASPLLTVINSDFASGVPALRVLSLGLPFFFVTSATMWALVALKKQILLTGVYGVSMTINIVGNILLVPQYGFMAAAWMTVVSEGFVLALSALVLVQSFSRTKKQL